MQVPVTIRIEDVNDSPPVFQSDKLVMYIAENSPIGSTVGELYAKDPDEGLNAAVQYSIIGNIKLHYKIVKVCVSTIFQLFAAVG